MLVRDLSEKSSSPLAVSSTAVLCTDISLGYDMIGPVLYLLWKASSMKSDDARDEGWGDDSLLEYILNET